MKHQRLRRGVLAVGISVVFLAGSAWAMGKKPTPETINLGHGGTMTQSYDPLDPLTGTRTLIMTIGKDGDTMTITKEDKEGAILTPPRGSSPTSLGSSSGRGPSSHPGRGQGRR